MITACVEQFARGLMSTVDIESVTSKMSGITPIQYYEMNSYEKFQFNNEIATLEYLRPDIDISSFRKRIDTNEINYKYKYSANNEVIYFKNAKEVSFYFKTTINKVWINVKNGSINGMLEKINELHILNSNNELIKVIKDDRHYIPL